MLPSSDSDELLGNKFSEFLHQKIENIRKTFNTSSSNISPNSSHLQTPTLCSFTPTNVEEIKKVIMKSPSKSCELDALPTSLIKDNIDVLALYITNIVIKPLLSGIFPKSQKIAYVRPLIKKPTLDKEIFKNYRPISNLKFLGKTIERIVSNRISDHITTFSLSHPYQSAYKQYHGTETALLRVNNDILTSLDSGKITALILLDLNAAFDTVDHSILISRLHDYLGVQDLALDWCKSYLSDRPKYVRIGTSTSQPTVLDYSVPQGSVLGPQWFTVYTYPVRDIIRSYNLNYHVYADDTQLYLSFNSSQQHANSATATLELCINEIRQWMKSNFLKLMQPSMGTLNSPSSRIVKDSTPSRRRISRYINFEIGES